MPQNENVNLILNLMLTSVGKHTNKPNNNKNNQKKKNLTFYCITCGLKASYYSQPDNINKETPN